MGLTLERPTAPDPCPHCGKTIGRMDVFDELGNWLWSRCTACMRAWGWPFSEPSLFDIPPTKETA